MTTPDTSKRVIQIPERDAGIDLAKQRVTQSSVLDGESASTHTNIFVALEGVERNKSRNVTPDLRQTLTQAWDGENGIESFLLQFGLKREYVLKLGESVKTSDVKAAVVRTFYKIIVEVQEGIIGSQDERIQLLEGLIHQANKIIVSSTDASEIQAKLDAFSQGLARLTKNYTTTQQQIDIFIHSQDYLKQTPEQIEKTAESLSIAIINVKAGGAHETFDSTLMAFSEVLQKGLKVSLKEITERRKDVVIANSKIIELSEALTEARNNSENQAEIAKLQSELESAQHAMKEAQRRLETILFDLNQQKEKTIIAEHNARIANQQRDSAQASEKIALQQAQNSKEKTAQAEADRDRAHEQASQAEARVRDLENQLAGASSKAEVEKLTSALAQAQDEARTARGLAQQAEDDLYQVASTVHQLAGHLGDEKLRADLAEAELVLAKQELATAQTNFQKAQADLVKAQNDLTTETAAKQAAEAAKLKAEADLATAQANFQAAEAAKKQAENDLAQAKIDLQKATDDLADANRLKKAAEDERDQANIDKGLADKRAQQAEAAKQAAEAAKKQAENDLAQAKIDLQKATDDLADANRLKKAAEDERDQANIDKGLADKRAQQAEAAKKQAEDDLAQAKIDLQKANEDLVEANRAKKEAELALEAETQAKEQLRQAAKNTINDFLRLRGEVVNNLEQGLNEEKTGKLTAIKKALQTGTMKEKTVALDGLSELFGVKEKLGEKIQCLKTGIVGLFTEDGTANDMVAKFEQELVSMIDQVLKSQTDAEQAAKLQALEEKSVQQVKEIEKLKNEKEKIEEAIKGFDPIIAQMKAIVRSFTSDEDWEKMERYSALAKFKLTGIAVDKYNETLHRLQRSANMSQAGRGGIRTGTWRDELMYGKGNGTYGPILPPQRAKRAFLNYSSSAEPIRQPGIINIHRGFSANQPRYKISEDKDAKVEQEEGTGIIGNITSSVKSKIGRLVNWLTPDRFKSGNKKSKVEKLSEEKIEPVVKPVVESAEPVINPVEPVVESVVEPEVEPGAESVIEPSVIKKSITEPLVEIIEKMSDPIEAKERPKGKLWGKESMPKKVSSHEHVSWQYSYLLYELNELFDVGNNEDKQWINNQKTRLKTAYENAQPYEWVKQLAFYAKIRETKIALEKRKKDIKKSKRSFLSLPSLRSGVILGTALAAVSGGGIWYKMKGAELGTQISQPLNVPTIPSVVEKKNEIWGFYKQSEQEKYGRFKIIPEIFTIEGELVDFKDLEAKRMIILNSSMELDGFIFTQLDGKFVPSKEVPNDKKHEIKKIFVKIGEYYLSATPENFEFRKNLSDKD